MLIITCANGIVMIDVHYDLGEGYSHNGWSLWLNCANALTAGPNHFRWLMKPSSINSCKDNPLSHTHNSSKIGILRWKVTKYGHLSHKVSLKKCFNITFIVVSNKMLPWI